VGPLVRATLEPLERALLDAKLDRDRISDIVLVGGSSRMPLVRRLLAETFRREPRDGVHPDEAIALGAAVQAGIKSGALSSERGIMITDVCPFTLGVEVVGQSGPARVEGLFAPIIPRNSTVPVSRTEVYATTGDNQRLVDIKIYQGEARLTRHNHFLDAYTIDGIPPAPAGREKVAVTFAYDINGILNVKTQIVSTGKEALLVVDGSPERMSPGERAAARSRLASEWPAALAVPHDGGAGPSRELVAVAARRLAARGPGAVYERVADAMAALEAALAAGDAAARARADAALTHLLFELDE
jgi:molecular chaperone DnaK